MAKRFTDTEKWKKPFLRGLEGPYKLLWFYILDDCDMAGIWQPDFEVAEIRIGERVTSARAIELFGDRIKIFDNGTKWFIKDFIQFQYGELKATNRMHNAVISTLKKNNLDFTDGASEPLPRGQGQGQGQGKGQGIRQGQGQGGEQIYPSSILQADELCMEALTMQAKNIKINLQECLDNWDGWYCSKFTNWRKDWADEKLTFQDLRKSFEAWMRDPKSRDNKPKVNGISADKLQKFKSL
jgi:hypothetical protein